MIFRALIIDGVHSGFRDVDWTLVKNKRDQELTDTDWRAVKDRTMSQAWKDYRQFLRDLPQNYTEANDAADAWAETPRPE